MTDLRIKNYDAAKKWLKSMIKSPNNKLIIAMHSVSKSGITRKMSAYSIVKNDLVCLNFWLEQLDPRLFKRDKGGRIIVGGCGMDMLWWLNDAIKGSVFGKKYNQIFSQQQYSSIL